MTTPTAPSGNTAGKAAGEKRTYWCFISYRHADNKEAGRQWATWLHQSIETYEVPADLVGSTNGRGEIIPERIFPVFRDEEELPADADLASPIYRALENSQCLIVICSPRAVESKYVASEIRYFKQLGRTDRVLAAIVDGEPNTSWDVGKQTAGFERAQECFPEPLRHEVGANGEVLEARNEPVAADFRLTDGSQGWTTVEAYRQSLKKSGGLNSRNIATAVEEYRKKSELMKLKVIAGILGVDLGTLTKRDAAYQLAIAQRRTRVLRRWLAAVAVLAVLAISGGILALIKQREAEFQREQTEKAHLHLLIDTASTRLREQDVRLAAGIILEVYSRRKTDRSIVNDASVVFQEARAADFQVVGIAGHTAPVRFVAYSPDGRELLTASDDNTVGIWDVSTGARLAVLKGHEGAVRGVNYSPNGKRIVTASADRTARIWDAMNYSEIGVLRGHTDAVNSAAYSPDGSSIVTASDDRTARVWNADFGTSDRVLNGHDAAVMAATWSVDGRNIVTASMDKTARVWNADTGQQKLVLSGHHEFVFSGVYSPDGQHIVTASQDNTARIWDAEKGESLLTLSGHLRSVNSANYSPDGRAVVTASLDKTVRIWDATTGAQLRVLSGHLNNVCAAVYSPDGRFVATASEDKSARIWFAAPSAQLAVLTGHTDIVTSASYSPSGTTILDSSGDKTAAVWDAVSGKLIGQLIGHTGLVNSALYSPDGSRIVTASYDGTARVWDAGSWREIFTIKGPSIEPVTDAAYSHDGKIIATSSFDRAIRLWNAATGGALAVLEGHENTVRSVAFSPNDRSLVSSSDDRTARIWDVAEKKQILKLSGHTDVLRSAAYSPDGRSIITSSNDLTAIIWDAATGQQRLTLSGHKAALRSANYSSDGKYVVTGSYDRTARIWDAAGGSQLACFQVHGEGVRCANYSPDNTRIVTSSLDNTAAIWKAQIPADLDAQFKWLRAAQFDPLTDSELSQLGLALERNKSRYRNPSANSDPVALAHVAGQAEGAAIAESSESKRTDLLLTAFRNYALAVENAPTASDAVMWRYHRATLARRLAQFGKMADVARLFASEETQ